MVTDHKGLTYCAGIARGIRRVQESPPLVPYLQTRRKKRAGSQGVAQFFCTLLKDDYFIVREYIPVQLNQPVASMQ